MKNVEKIGAIMAIAGVMLMVNSAVYMLIKLHWILSATLVGFLLMCVGLKIIDISKDNEDEEEEQP